MGIMCTFPQKICGTKILGVMYTRMIFDIYYKNAHIVNEYDT